MTQWGNWIEAGSVGYPVRGETPAWLNNADRMQWSAKDGSPNWSEGADSVIASDFGKGVSKFRLPHDHWAYAPIAAGYTPWAGGETAPADWDGGGAMLRDGTQHSPNGWQSGLWQRNEQMKEVDIIGYKRRTVAPAEPAPPPPWATDIQPLYVQARNLLNVLCERYGVTVTPLTDVAGILTQIDNVTTGVHVPTLDVCISKASMMLEIGSERYASVRNDERESVMRQLEALRPTPPDPVETLARELADVVNNLPDAYRQEWEKMPEQLRKTYRALARHTLDRPAKT